MAVLTAKLAKANLRPVELLKAFAVTLPIDVSWGKWVKDLKIQIVPVGSTGTVLACLSAVRLLTSSLYKILQSLVKQLLGRAKNCAVEKE